MGNKRYYSALQVSVMTGIRYEKITTLCNRFKIDAEKVKGRWSVSEEGLRQAREIHNLQSNDWRRKAKVKPKRNYGSGFLTLKETAWETGVNVHVLEALCKHGFVSYKGEGENRMINRRDFGDVMRYQSKWYKDNFKAWSKLR